MDRVDIMTGVGIFQERIPSNAVKVEPGSSSVPIRNPVIDLSTSDS